MSLSLYRISAAFVIECRQAGNVGSKTLKQFYVLKNMKQNFTKIIHVTTSLQPKTNNS